MSTITILSVLALLTIKHYIVDFILQTEKLVKEKKQKNSALALHASHHGIGTTLVFFFFVGPWYGIFMGILDFLIHAIVDYLKVHAPTFKAKPMSHMFFVYFGLDQLLHQLTYIFLVWLVL